MKHTSTTFREFTSNHIRNFPDNFRHLDTPVQVYPLQNLLSKHIITPTPILKADFNFIVFLTKGSFEQRVGTDIKKVAPDQALLIVEGEVSSLLKKSKDVDGFFIIFKDKTLQQLKDYSFFVRLFTASPIIKLQKSDAQFISQVSQLITQELETDNPDEQIVFVLFQSLLLKILKSSELKKRLDRQFDIAVKYRNLVHRNYQEISGINTYAKQLNISANYLNRCVQNVWNKSAKQLAQEISIVQSQSHLQDFSKSIAEVAYELGYSDPSYFSRLFRKIVGISPQSYRKAAMHDLS